MTKTIALSHGKKTTVNDCDYEWIMCLDLGWRAIKDRHTYYAIADHRGTTVRMPRIILNVPPGMQVDHIDGNGLNNIRENIRIVTPAQNGMNKRIPIDNKTGYKGVYIAKDRKVNKYKAQIRVNYKAIYLGCFDNPEDAAKAYNRAAIKHFGEFAKLNVI